MNYNSSFSDAEGSGLGCSPPAPVAYNLAIIG